MEKEDTVLDSSKADFVESSLFFLLSVSICYCLLKEGARQVCQIALAFAIFKISVKQGRITSPKCEHEQRDRIYCNMNIHP